MRIPMHRFKYTKLTKEQIGARLKAAEGGPQSASAFSNLLNGKTLYFNYERNTNRMTRALFLCSRTRRPAAATTLLSNIHNRVALCLLQSVSRSLLPG